MSKAVLVVDMPDSCDMCDFSDSIGGKLYCCVPGYGDLVEDFIACRPDWCPMHPVPEKKMLKSDVRDVQSLAEVIADASWNSCIDSLLGSG